MTEEMNQYLWNKSGTVDPDIEHLEKQLSELRYAPTEPAFLASALAAGPRPRRSLWHHLFQFGGFRVAGFTAAALLVLIVIGALMIRYQLAWNENRPWTITRVSGSLRIENGREGKDRLAVGQSLVTDASSSAEIKIANIGSMVVEPDSSVRLLETETGRHRVALQYGTVRARTWAPPFSFAIQTPSSVLFDLGCAFTLHVEKDGWGLVRVESGWVQFEYGNDQTIVPAGAEAITRPHLGPGSVYFPDASTAFKTALNDFDTSPAGSAQQETAIAVITHEARARDTITLLTLLRKVDRPQRDVLLDTMQRFVPIPSGATREQVLNLDPLTIDRYWRELGLGNPKSWLMHWRDPL